MHGAAGGVGSAPACSSALAGGARVLRRCARRRTRAFVEELGAEAIPDDGFADAVAGGTGGRGVDVILELVGAPHFPGNLDALALTGRIAIVGVGAGQNASTCR